MATVTLPKEWALHMTHMASEFVHAQFKNFLAGGPLLKPPQHLQAEISLACIELARALVVHQATLALQRNESGTNDTRKQDLLNRFPPSTQLALTKPAVLIDAGGRQILWYLPCVISRPLQADMYVATA
ncbi:hypothetical protein AZE42_13245 [Rhizopogon vesiculosus]|uniref:Uncharacterized protein n=1 Tax=Rhizopogon vesiculosus TaxID=180088 RepID=A0A1J8QC68_9AGAM|nr:hypothetical protein AZE42_13245 [Rhizopogon vesiculosus]